ncbi:MAG: Calx-beta domain-containing protein [Cyanobacteriota bacterium]|nr:Calx-beta domain-containing protein [Cyanobacteriota bacterium]
MALKTWDGGAVHPLWHIPLNWNGDTLPVAGDDISIGPGFSRTEFNGAATSAPNLTINTLSSDSPLTLSGGSLTVSSTATFSSSLVLTGLSTLNLSAASPITLTSLTQMGGASFNSAANLTVSGPSSFSGDHRGPGTSLLAGPSVFNASVWNLDGGRTLQNDSTFTWSNGIITFNQNRQFLALPGTDSIINSPRGTFIIDGDFANIITVVDLASSGANSLFSNAGTVQKSGSSALATTRVFVPFINSGIVDIQTGNLNFLTRYNQTAGETHLNGGTFLSDNDVSISGGVLTGAGRIDLNNTGIDNLILGQATLSPGHSSNPYNTLTLEGNLRGSGNATLQMDIGGPAQVDRLVITNAANFASGDRINISLSPGFVPNIGDRFQILTFGSAPANLASLLHFPNLAIDATRRFQPSFSSTDLTLEVVAIPQLPTITLEVTPSSGVLEDGSGRLTYTFRRTGPINSPLAINYTLAGSATLSTDFTVITPGPRGTVTFAAQSPTASVTVSPVADTTVELNETVALSLVSAPTYTIGTASPVIGTILNDDLPVINLAITSNQVMEDGAANLIYTFTRTGPLNTPLAVNYTVGGSASLGTDYTGIAAEGLTKTVNFSSGSDTASVIVDPTNDASFENDESVLLTLAAGTGYTTGTTSAITGTILNDDLPSITLALFQRLGEITWEDSSTFAFVFFRTGDFLPALSVNYTVSGSATLGTDYTGIAASPSIKTARFGLGQNTATVNVVVRPDQDIEPDETIQLALQRSPRYNISTAQPVTATIVNDDPRVSVSRTSAAEVLEDQTDNLVYTFTRTGPTTNPLSVNYSIAGTASLDTDYALIGDSGSNTSRSITFATGVNSIQVIIDPRFDLLVEDDETISLQLTPGAGYTFLPPPAIGNVLDLGIIRNDDRASLRSTILADSDSNLELLGGRRVNGSGNGRDNTIAGNTNNNRLAGLGGADLLTGGGKTDRDIFVYTSLRESLLGEGNGFDVITDFNSTDFIQAPDSVSSELLSTVVGTCQVLTASAIQAILTPATFAANGVAAFAVSTQPGTFISMNDDQPGYQANSDAIVQLRDFSLSPTSFVDFI